MVGKGTSRCGMSRTVTYLVIHLIFLVICFNYERLTLDLNDETMIFNVVLEPCSTTASTRSHRCFPTSNNTKTTPDIKISCEHPTHSSSYMQHF